MIKPNTRLSNIPPDLQKKYKIGSELVVEATGIFEGGRYKFINNDGKKVEVAAKDFSGRNVSVTDIY